MPPLDRGGRGVSDVAGPAVHRPVAAGTEGHRRGGPALRTDRFVRRTGRARGSIPALDLTGLTAVPAALRLVLKTFFRIELLVANRESERAAAFFTGDALVFQGRPPDRETDLEYPTCVSSNPRLAGWQGHRSPLQRVIRKPPAPVDGRRFLLGWLIGHAHEVDFIGMPHAQELLIVHDRDVPARAQALHLIRGLSVGGKHAIEMR
jgi:hypothetical protein